ncbi:MAG: threonylcarbamoyl-AMP synthase [Candidatus Thiodiazotropha sp. (ex Monitilora ramsayi)]|nr:threonylcarbamoyl-AMP synthase [Candidatus Thiodiazotropha sp. (ex Monitilora ramsayi)]
MAQFFQIHPDNPQPRLIKQAVSIMREGGLVVYPTDSSYALGCHIGDKGAMERIRRIRKVGEEHNFTLVCRDLTEISNYAKIDNRDYRLLKNMTPGPYTFIHNATKQVPRRLMHPKRRTIGIRVPDNAIVSALLEELGEPIMSTTMIMPGEEMPLTDPYEMRDLLDHHVDLIIDGGYCGFEPTTVVVMTEDVPQVVRAGKGDASLFEV